jgi:hypothetical protein
VQESSRPLPRQSDLILLPCVYSLYIVSNDPIYDSGQATPIFALDPPSQGDWRGVTELVKVVLNLGNVVTFCFAGSLTLGYKTIYPHSS